MGTWRPGEGGEKDEIDGNRRGGPSERGEKQGNHRKTDGGTDPPGPRPEAPGVAGKKGNIAICNGRLLGGTGVWGHPGPSSEREHLHKWAVH